MKNSKFVSLLLMAFFVASTQFIFAQPKSTNPEKDPCEKCFEGISDLTDVQKQKIEDLNLAHLKVITGLKNQMNEKNAHLKTLQSVDKPDMTAVNKTIDEITAIKADMMKKCASNKQSIRGLLTDNQKIVFDAKASKGGCGHEGGSYCKGHGAKGCGEKGNNSNCKH